MTHDWFTVDYDEVSNPTLIASIQTFDGTDPAALRYQNLGSTSVQVKVEEEHSADAESGHVSEVIGYVVISD